MDLFSRPSSPCTSSVGTHAASTSSSASLDVRNELGSFGSCYSCPTDASSSTCRAPRRKSTIATPTGSSQTVCTFRARSPCRGGECSFRDSWGACGAVGWAEIGALKHFALCEGFDIKIMDCHVTAFRKFEAWRLLLAFEINKAEKVYASTFPEYASAATYTHRFSFSWPVPMILSTKVCLISGLTNLSVSEWSANEGARNLMKQ